MGYLRGPAGEQSSKRLVGLSYAALGIFIVVAKMFMGSDIGLEWFISAVSVSLAALGISAAEKFSKFATTDPDPGEKPSGGQQ